MSPPDYSITLLDDSGFREAGSTSEVKYKISNLTKFKLLISEFNVIEEHLEMVQAPPKSLEPFSEAIIICKATVPEDYDQKFDHGLRPKFTGVIQKILP